MIPRHFWSTFCLLVVLCFIQPLWASGLELGGSSGTSGVGFYSEGRWGQVSILVNNRGTTPQSGRVVFWFNHQPNVQYVRDVWLPGRSARRVQIPVRLPDRYESTQNSIEATTILLPPGEVDNPESGRQPSLLRVETGSVVSAGVFEIVGNDESATDAAVAGRQAAVDSARFAYLQPAEMPFFPAGYEALDVLVLDNLNAQLDSAQLESIRAWVMGGGRLWVMYDTGSQDLLARLLKEDWRVTTVDDVQLNDVRFAPADSKSRYFEDPVHFRRVIAPGMTVLQSVNGWPAALSQPVGRGEVVITTIDPQALVVRGSQPTAGDALRDIAPMVFRAVPPSPVSDNNLESFQKSLIGYSIIGRGPVIVILAVFVVVLALGGVILRRKNRQELLAPLGAAMAVGIALVLIVMGSINRGKVPLMVVSSQFARVVPEQGAAVINGMISVYSPVEGKGPIEATDGGVIWPNLDGQKGELLRMAWSDINKWQWLNLKLPAGATRDSRMTQFVKLDSVPRAIVSFNEAGAVGKLSGFPGGQSPASVLVATGEGRGTAKVQQDEFVITPQSILKPGQFTFDVIDQDLERRIGVWSRMFESRGYPGSPVLLAWGQGPALGIRLVQDSEIKNAALMELPIEFSPAAPGTKVTIPSIFVGLAEDRSGAGTGLVSVYSPSTGIWQGKLTSAQDFGGRFFIPRQVMPLVPTKLELRVGMNAPGRVVKVFVVENRKPREVDSRTSPSGVYTIDLAKAGVKLSADGSLLFKVSVSDTATSADVYEDQLSQWDVSGVWLDVAGTVGP